MMSIIKISRAEENLFKKLKKLLFDFLNLHKEK